jgi:hypothetical protein
MIMTAKCSVEINTGRESEGACRQDELIRGKPLVVKYYLLFIIIIIGGAVLSP